MSIYSVYIIIYIQYSIQQAILEVLSLQKNLWLQLYHSEQEHVLQEHSSTLPSLHAGVLSLRIYNIAHQAISRKRDCSLAGREQKGNRNRELTVR